MINTKHQIDDLNPNLLKTAVRTIPININKLNLNL